MSESAPSKIDLDDEAGLKYWQEHYGVTEEQLREAVQAAGDDPGAVEKHFLNQGASAGPS